MVFLIWMPNSQKQDWRKGLDEDDQDIISHLRKAGFLVQRRIRMGLTLHPTVANKTSELEWFADGRLAMLAKTEADIKDWWVNSSELARIKRVVEVPQLPLAKDIVPLSSMDPDAEINQESRSPDMAAKCAQRGPAVAEVQLKSLLAKASWTKADELVIIDLLPYVGDRVLGSYNFAKSPEAENIGRIRHLILTIQAEGKKDKAAAFSVKRLSNIMNREWLNRTIVLKNTTKDALVNLKNVPVYPSDSVPPPTEEQLRSIMGGVNAYKGMASLPLKVCYLRGSKVKIQPSKLEEFQGAPLEVADAIGSLVKEHESTYENLLAESEESQTSTDLSDARRDGDAADMPPMELVSFESLDNLKATCNIVSTAKGIDKSLTLLKDDKEAFYIMSSKDAVLNVGSLIGGIGGGSALPEDPCAKKCWPWDLPQGDKTWVQVARAAADGADEAKPKVVAGTLYSQAREIEASATGPPKLTSFGKLIPSGTAGRHAYSMEHPQDAPEHEKLAFTPTPPAGAPKEATAQNFFAKAVHRDSYGVGNGALQLCWRLTYDTVANVLKPTKPQVVVRERIALSSGKPVRVAWPKETTTGTA
jgi:hypothetical protein